MVRHRSEFPPIDELVMCTIKKVFAQGAFAALDEYEGIEGMVHLSEVASGWVKNIRDFVRENQKVVCMVLAVDLQKKHIDLSIRRVKDSERRWKTQRVKLNQRAEKLLELAAKKLDKTLDQAYDEAGFELQEKFGDLYSAMEAASRDANSIKAIAGEEWTNVIGSVASSTFEPPSCKVFGYVDLSSSSPDGVEVIKSAMITARDSAKEEDVDVEVYYIGSPRYRIDVTAPSYKVAENSMQKAVRIMLEQVKKAGGKGEFREG